MRPFLLRGLLPATACAPVLALAATLAPTTQARADFITITGAGDYEVVGGSEFTETLAMSLAVLSQTGGFGFTAVDLELTHDFTDPGVEPATGSLMLMGTTPGDYIAGDLSGTWETSSVEPLLSAFSGTWMSTEAAGEYAGLSGAGTLAGVAITFDEMSGTASVLFTGNLVPAAPVAALFALAVAGPRRRRTIGD